MNSSVIPTPQRQAFNRWRSAHIPIARACVLGHSGRTPSGVAKLQTQRLQCGCSAIVIPGSLIAVRGSGTLGVGPGWRVSVASHPGESGYFKIPARPEDSLDAESASSELRGLVARSIASPRIACSVEAGMALPGCRRTRSANTRRASPPCVSHLRAGMPWWGPIHPKAMPVILTTPEECETWIGRITHRDEPIPIALAKSITPDILFHAPGLRRATIVSHYDRATGSPNFRLLH